jgi:hypothetical protein
VPRTDAVDVRAFWLLAAQRYDIPSGTVGIGYSRGRLPAELVFAGVAVLELVAVDVFVPWDRLGGLSWLRFVVLAASIYGVIWIAAWMAAERVRPHLVTSEELQLRWGHLSIASVPLAGIRDVRVHRRYTDDDTRLTHDVPLQGTNLDLELHMPLDVRLPFRRRTRSVTGISLGVDDPEAAATLIRARLTT